MKFKKPPTHLLLCGIFGGLVCLLVLAAQYLPRFESLRRFEWMTYDWRSRQAAAHSPLIASNLGFVFISDHSIDALLDGSLDYQVGLYWPRHVYGRLVQELHAQGARAVGFDIMFAELRKDHPPAMLADGTKMMSDYYFADALAAAGNVALAASKGIIPAPAFLTNAWAVADITARPEADGVSRRAKAYQDFYVWHSEIRKAERVQGFDLRQARFESNRLVIPFPDRSLKTIPLEKGLFDQVALYETLEGVKAPTGVVRWVSPATPLRAWDMGIQLAAKELGLDLSKADIQLDRGRIVLTGSNSVSRVIPVDGDGRFYIDWSITPYDKRLTAESIDALLMQERDRRLGKTNSEPNRWKDKLVFVGSIASGNDLTDTGPTPLEREAYLTSRFWNVANSVIQNRFTRAPSLAMTLGLSLIGCGLAGFFTWRLRSLGFAVIGVVLVAAVYIAIARQVYVHDRIWLPIFFPLLALFLTHVGLVTYKAFFEQNERRRIKAVFDHIVSPNVVTELLQAENLSFGGSRRNVTVFFADVRGFTEMSDDTHAKAEEYVRANGLKGAEADNYTDAQTKQLLDTVNLYLSLIADIVKRNEGTLDKYIGDCVMAFWGAPTPNLKHAGSAVRSAIEAQRAIQALNDERAAENARRETENVRRQAAGQHPLPLHHLLSLGTGVNTGTAVVGLMGSPAHILNYTVFGRAVNLASRLESISARGRIIVGESTFEALQRDHPDLAEGCIEMTPTKVKGFRVAVKIFEVPWRTSVEHNDPSAITTDTAFSG